MVIYVCEQKMNEKTLTPFQNWCLFLMFDNNINSYTSKDLQTEYPDTTISQSDPNHFVDELDHLVIKKLLNKSTKQKKYQISGDGLKWIKLNISNIINANKNDKIKQDIIQQQEQKLIVKFKNKSSDLDNVIVRSAIKNIGPIISLLDSLSIRESTENTIV